MSDAELRDRIDIIHTGRDLTWRERLRLAYRTPILVVVLLLALAMVFYSGRKSVSVEEINQKRAWEVQVATYDKCFDEFVKPIPKAARPLRQARSESCLDVAQVAMNERYQARRGKNGTR